MKILVIILIVFIKSEREDIALKYQFLLHFALSTLYFLIIIKIIILTQYGLFLSSIPTILKINVHVHVERN